jgi:hypothetical protein
MPACPSLFLPNGASWKEMVKAKCIPLGETTLGKLFAVTYMSSVEVSFLSNYFLCRKHDWTLDDSVCVNFVCYMQVVAMIMKYLYTRLQCDVILYLFVLT